MSEGQRIEVSVSVVIPLYNKAAYIARAMDSVLAQTYPDFELIVVDDGSTDGSGEIVAKYDNPRVKLLVQENAGECAARNRGVSESQARWVAFLDADDEWLPEFLEQTMAVAETNPSLLAVFTNFKRAPTNTCAISHRTRGATIQDYMHFHVTNNGRGMSSSSVVVRKEPLLAVGGFPVGVRHGGDTDTWARLAWTGEVEYVPKILAIYHTEALGRVMNENTRPTGYAHEAVVASYHQWKQQGRIPQRLLESSRRYIECAFLRHAAELVRIGNTADARRVLRTECRAKLCGPYRYFKTYLATLIPARLLDCYWRLKKL